MYGDGILEQNLPTENGSNKDSEKAVKAANDLETINEALIEPEFEEPNEVTDPSLEINGFFSLEKHDGDSESDDLFDHHQIVTDRGQHLTRLDRYLTDRLPNVSRTKVQNAIRAGAVKVDGKDVKPNFKIGGGQIISMVLASSSDNGFVEPQNIPLNIVFEDEDVLVLNKPAGLVVHPGLGNPRGTLVNGLAYYFQGKDQLPIRDGIADRPGLVHRIDKDTSGLMVIAKNEYAMQHLANQFFHHTIERRYWAIVWGQPEVEEGTIDVRIGRHPMDRSFITAFPNDDEAGKNAVTHYKCLEPMYYVSLVECKLETGRTHQIRVHMKYLGHPLFQDERYGGHRIMKGTIFTKYRQFVQNCFKVINRQGLHAKTLGFEHPRTGEFVRFSSELPDDMQNVLMRWRDYLSSRKELLNEEKEKKQARVK